MFPLLCLLYTLPYTLPDAVPCLTREDGKEHWERPQEGTLKVNVDAAIFVDPAHIVSLC